MCGLRSRRTQLPPVADAERASYDTILPGIEPTTPAVPRSRCRCRDRHRSGLPGRRDRQRSGLPGRLSSSAAPILRCPRLWFLLPEVTEVPLEVEARLPAQLSLKGNKESRANKHGA